MQSDAKRLNRYLYQLIISHLQNEGFAALAAEVSDATLTPARPEIAPGRLLNLVQAGMQVERDRGMKDLDFVGGNDSDEEEGPMPGRDDDPSGMSLTERDVHGIQDFQAEYVEAQGRPPRPFPTYSVRHTAGHKNSCRVAKFSPDGVYLASGSADTAIKIMDARGLLHPESRKADDGKEFRPVIKTLYDHMEPLNDLEFHPRSPILVSASRDDTIKFFDFTKYNSKRAFTFLKETHNVRTIGMHPSGEYLLAGTEHHMIRLYDLTSLQRIKCYTSSTGQNLHYGSINHVRYTPDGSMYASCSKDGQIKIWDGVSSQCVNTISKPHAGFEVWSVSWSRNGKYLLSNGKDSTVRLWDCATWKMLQQYTGHTQQKSRTQAMFSYNEEHVMSSDERSHNIFAWDTRTAAHVATLQSGHSQNIRSLTFSPADVAFASCSDDFRVKIWALDKAPQKQQ